MSKAVELYQLFTHSEPGNPTTVNLVCSASVTIEELKKIADEAEISYNTVKLTIANRMILVSRTGNYMPAFEGEELTLADAIEMNIGSIIYGFIETVATWGVI